jgi:hypothetical protein
MLRPPLKSALIRAEGIARSVARRVTGCGVATLTASRVYHAPFLVRAQAVDGAKSWASSTRTDVELLLALLTFDGRHVDLLLIHFVIITQLPIKGRGKKCKR